MCVRIHAFLRAYVACTDKCRDCRLGLKPMARGHKVNFFALVSPNEINTEATTPCFTFFCAGTVLCLPPEWAATGKYQAESGAVWSLGVLLFEMLTRKLPFDDAL